MASGLVAGRRVPRWRGHAASEAPYGTRGGERAEDGVYVGGAPATGVAGLTVMATGGGRVTGAAAPTLMDRISAALRQVVAAETVRACVGGRLAASRLAPELRVCGSDSATYGPPCVLLLRRPVTENPVTGRLHLAP